MKKSKLTLVPSFSGNMRAVFCYFTMAQFAFIMVMVLTQLYFIHRLPQITDEINRSYIPRRQHQKLKWVLTSVSGYLKSQKFNWSMWVHTYIIITTPFEELLGSTSEYTSIIKTLFEELSGYNRDIHKVKERQHRYPEFGHKGVRLKNTVKGPLLLIAEWNSDYYWIFSLFPFFHGCLHYCMCCCYNYSQIPSCIRCTDPVLPAFYTQIQYNFSNFGDNRLKLSFSWIQ